MNNETDAVERSIHDEIAAMLQRIFDEHRSIVNDVSTDWSMQLDGSVKLRHVDLRTKKWV